jgi:hypothetical protein
MAVPLIGPALSACTTPPPSATPPEVNVPVTFPVLTVTATVAVVSAPGRDKRSGSRARSQRAGGEQGRARQGLVVQVGSLIAQSAYVDRVQQLRAGGVPQRLARRGWPELRL